MKKIYLLLFILIGSAIIYFQLSLDNSKDKTINIYSSRKEKFISELADEFTKNTGIKVNILIDKAPKLIAKLEVEGKNTPADILITSDVINIQKAKKLDLLKKFEDQDISSLVPKQYRDNEDCWVGISVRSRLIFYNNQEIKDGEIQNYEDLARRKYKNSILVSSASNPYNQALLSQILLHNGSNKAKKIIESITNNFARTPQGGDTDQLKALARGEGKIAIANNYYYMRLKNSKDKIVQEYIKNISVVYPNQDSYGMNINLSTIAITRHSKNTHLASQFIKFMLSHKAQNYFVHKNYEQSVNLNLNNSTVSTLKADEDNLKEYYNFSGEASEIADESGWK